MEVEKSVKPTSMPAMVDVSVHHGQLYANTRYGMVYAFPAQLGSPPEIILRDAVADALPRPPQSMRLERSAVVVVGRVRGALGRRVGERGEGGQHR